MEYKPYKGQGGYGRTTERPSQSAAERNFNESPLYDSNWIKAGTDRKMVEFADSKGITYYNYLEVRNSYSHK